MSARLQIQTFTLGNWMTNCYVVSTDAGGCWIIDAGFGPGKILDYLTDRQLTPQQVVLTHGHVDHIAGLQQIREAWPRLPILIHADEAAFPGDAALNLSIALAEPVIAPEPTQLLRQGEVLMLDDLPFEVRHTPGHSPGGICLYQQANRLAIVGDTLFAGSVGRHDFPTSDGQALFRAIREQLLPLPDDTRVLPGHGMSTTIGHEREHNPYLTRGN